MTTTLEPPLLSDQPRGRLDAIDISVLIPVLDEQLDIRATVAAMQAQRFDGQLEFLFIDGGSRDDTVPILRELARDDPRIRVLPNPSRHTAAALNVGLHAARGRYIARMDAHSFYPPDYVALGVRRLERGDVAWVVGPSIPFGVDRWSRRTAIAIGSWMGNGGSGKWALDDAPLQSMPEREMGTGVFAGVWRRETLLEHGGWDEGWPINQDSELAARFLARAQRIVQVPAMGARYVPRRSLRAMSRQYRRYGFYRAKTSCRHPESTRPAHLLMPGITLTALGALLAPRPLRRLARIGLALYLLTMGEAGRRAAARGERADAVVVPAIYTTMHLSWGIGYLTGWVRFGPPLAPLAHVTGLAGLLAALRNRFAALRNR